MKPEAVVESIKTSPHYITRERRTGLSKRKFLDSPGFFYSTNNEINEVVYYTELTDFILSLFAIIYWVILSPINFFMFIEGFMENMIRKDLQRTKQATFAIVIPIRVWFLLGLVSLYRQMLVW